MSGLSDHPGWLVRDFWLHRSYGIIAGEPKSFKSTLCLDLALSVVSGKPFLGSIPVEEIGPVIYIQNENADWIIRDRLEKMAAAKELTGTVNIEQSINDKYIINISFPPLLPLYFINQRGFRLTDVSHRKKIEDILATIRPVLIIFDPLYLMIDDSLNDAAVLSGPLQWLIWLRRKYGCGIQLVHHWNKGGESSRGGQRMLGSTTLHGWTESAWYLRPVTGSPGTVTLEREFRAIGGHQLIDLTMRMGQLGEPVYEVKITGHAAHATGNVGDDLLAVRRILESNRDVRLSIEALGEMTSLGRRRTETAVRSLVRSGEVEHNRQGVKILAEAIDRQ